MLTKEEVLEKALAHADSKADTDTIAHAHRAISFQDGATWANDQNAARIAELEAQNAELIEALEAALAHGIQTREGRDIVFNILEKYKK